MNPETKWFLVYAENKCGGIRELTETEYLKMIGSHHTIGWIDNRDICIANRDGCSFLRITQLQQILNLINADKNSGEKHE